MSYAARRWAPPPLYPDGDPAHFEYGWLDMQGALTKILQGYALLIGGLSFCAFLVVISIVKIASLKPEAKLPIDALWLFYLGIGLPMVIGPAGYGMILVGKWRCLLHAPERFHCRWLMFACMTCVLIGPALNITSSITGLQTAPELKRGPEGFKQLNFTELGVALEAVGGVLALGSLVLFVLFLRAVAKCFDDQARVRLYNLYLALLTFPAALSVYVGFQLMEIARNAPAMLVGVAFVWFLAFLGYLFLIMSTNTCIRRGLAATRVPPGAPPSSAPAVATPERAWPVV